MNGDRESLGEILRTQGHAPAHLPGFEARLAAGLQEADCEMGRATGSWLRLPGRSRSLRTRRLVLATVAVGVATAVAVIVLIGVPGVPRTFGPEPVSAAEVVQKTLHALSECRTLQADATEKDAVAILPGGVIEYAVNHDRLLMRSDGSFRSTQTDKPQTSEPALRDRADAADTAYDAARGVLREYRRGWDWQAGASGSYVNQLKVTTGYPLGPPDCWANVALAGVSATARALQAGGLATMQTGSYDGRPVWVISGSKSGGSDPRLTGDETYSVTVDQQTCLPIRFRLLTNGVLQLDYSWHNVRVDEPLLDAAFTFAPPKGAKVVRKDGGFRRLPLARIGSAASYGTLLPAWLPDGFARRWAAFAAKATTANKVAEGRDVVAVNYVRGFDTLTVTTRIVADPRSAASYDPVEPDISWADILRRDVNLTAGSFAGATAAVVVGPWTTTPHLWAVKGHLMLTIAGSATADELITIAESLRSYRPD
jgi:hypothetical protein